MRIVQLVETLEPGGLERIAVIWRSRSRRPVTPHPLRMFFGGPLAEEARVIHWTDPTVEIYNLIRGVTKPFPGAFAYMDDDVEKKVLFWRAIPFDTQLVWPLAKPGEVIFVFTDNSFVVRTGDATLLVQEYEGANLTASDAGHYFSDLAKPRKVWKDLPD